MKSGDTLTIALSDKRFGICRVIKKAEIDLEKKLYGDNSWLIIPSHKIFPEIPLIEDIFPEKNLYIKNLKNQNKTTNPLRYLIKGYVNDPPSKEFIYLGNVPVTSDEAELIGTQNIEWGNIPNQWKKYINSATDALNEYTKANSLDNVPTANKFQELEKIKKEKLFDDWEGFIPPKVISEVRDIFYKTVDNLLQIEGGRNKEELQNILIKCIQNLNILDKENDGFIETSDIIEVIERIMKILHIEDFDSILNYREW